MPCWYFQIQFNFGMTVMDMYKYIQVCNLQGQDIGLLFKEKCLIFLQFKIPLMVAWESRKMKTPGPSYGSGPNRAQEKINLEK